MRKSIKTILYFVLEFIVFILLFILLGIFMLNRTVLNKSFTKSAINKSNISKEVYNNTKEEFSYYVLQSGLDEEVLDNIITEDDINKVLNDYIDAFYDNKTYKIDTSNIKSKLETNINNYLSKHNIKVQNKDDLNNYTKEIIDTYEDNIKGAFPLNSMSSKLIKLTKYTNIISIILLVIIVILIVVIKLVFKKGALAIPLISSGLLYLALIFYLKNNINMSNFYVYTKAFSSIVKLVYNTIISYLKWYVIILIITGVIISVVTGLIKSSKTKKNHTNK